jgi:hypothetical protein
VIRLETIGAEINVRLCSPDGWERSSGLAVDWLDAVKQAIRDDYAYDGGVEAYVNVELPADELLAPLAAYLAALMHVEISRRGKATSDEPLFFELPPPAELHSLAAKRAEKRRGQ